MKVGDLVKLHEWTLHPNQVGTVMEILPEDAARTFANVALHQRAIKSLWTSAPDSHVMIRVLIDGGLKMLMEHDCEVVE